jgi:hypothetical protein
MKTTYCIIIIKIKIQTFDNSAAGIQQVAKSAEDLNILTENLENLISKFKIDSYVEEKETHYSIRHNGKLVKS